MFTMPVPVHYRKLPASTLSVQFNASQVPTATELTRQPGPDYILSNALTCHPFTHTEHIGIIMFATHAGSIMIMTQGCPHMRIAIGSHGHAKTCAADQNPTIHSTCINLFTDQPGQIRIINRGSRITAQILDLMPQLVHQGSDHLF